MLLKHSSLMPSTLSTQNKNSTASMRFQNKSAITKKFSLLVGERHGLFGVFSATVKVPLIKLIRHEKTEH